MADSQRMKQASVQPLLLLGDLGCLLIAFSLSVYLRANLSINNQVAVGLEIPIWVYLAIPVFWILAAVPLGLYRPWASSKKHSAFLLPALNILINAVSIFTLSIFLMPVVPRLIYPLYILLSISMLLAFRLALRHFLASGLQARLTITTLAIWRKVTFIDNLLYERRADLIAVALASALWVFLNYRAGFAYTPDSVEYITMASKLRFSGQAAFLPYWPPLFPLLITLLTFLTPYPANAAMLLVSASTVGVLIVYAVLVRRIFHSSLLALVTVLILAGMGIFLNVATTAWSEMTFLLFVLLSMVFILRFSESYDSRAVYLALLFAGLAALTRYIGSAQLVIATVLIVWISRRAGKRVPIWPILVCNSFFITTLGLWTLRNKAIFGENWFDVWMGPRGSMVKDLPINLATTAQILGKDLSWPLIALVVVSLIYFASQIRRIQMNNMMVNSFVIFAVPVGYLIALLYSSSIYTPVLLDSRLLFPAYASLIVFAVAGGKEAIHAAWQAKNQFIRYFVPFFAVFLIGFSFVNNSRWILNQVNETIRHAGQANLHFYAGYGLSSTSERLARILAENLAASESLDIFVLVTPETQGRIFLLQKDVYKGLDVSSVRYSYGHGDDYSVMLHTKNGQDIRINYWFTSASESFYTLEPQDPQLLISQISQKIPRTSTAFLLVFLLNEQNAVAWQTILDAFSDQYTSIVYEVAPYEVAAFSHMELGN